MGWWHLFNDSCSLRGRGCRYLMQSVLPPGVCGEQDGAGIAFCWQLNTGRGNRKDEAPRRPTRF